jgi:glutamate synthase domain-containing protein 1
MPQPTPRFPLYRPDLERDACGIGLVADARGRRSHEIVEHALSALVRLTHRGAPPQTASIDGSGILTQIPWRVYRDDLPAVRPPAHARARHVLHAATLHRAEGADRDRAAPGRLPPVPLADDAGALHGLDATRRRHCRRSFRSPRSPTAGGPAEAALYCARVRMDHAAAREDSRISVVSLSTQTVVYAGRHAVRAHGLLSRPPRSRVQQRHRRRPSALQH